MFFGKLGLGSAHAPCFLQRRVIVVMTIMIIIIFIIVATIMTVTMGIVVVVVVVVFAVVVVGIVGGDGRSCQSVGGRGYRILEFRFILVVGDAASENNRFVFGKGAAVHFRRFLAVAVDRCIAH